MKERVGWTEISFSQTCENLSVNNLKIKQKEYLELGDFPIVDQGQQLIGGYYNDISKVIMAEPPFIIFGDHTKVKKYIPFKFIPGADGVKILKPHHFFNPKLFYYYLHIIKIPDKGYARHFQFLKKSILPLPPLPEQRAIVSKIEQLFSELDNGIANLKLAQEQLKVYRHAVLKQAFTGELTKKWREEQTDLPNAEALLEEIRRERQKNAKVSGKKEKLINPVDKDFLKILDELPQKWKWVKTAEIIDPINNGYTPKAPFLSAGSGEIPFIKVYNLNFDGTLNFEKDPTFIPEVIHQKELARSITLPDDVLINIVGPPLGKVSIVSHRYQEWNINQAIVLFRPNRWILSKFIAYYLQNPKTINWLENTSKATAGQYNVKVTTCREIPLPLCSIPEQQVIITEIETRLSVCEKLEQELANSLEKAEALHQSILKQAFEGKLLSEEELTAVRNDPEWEPAEALLSKIKSKTI